MAHAFSGTKNRRMTPLQQLATTVLLSIQIHVQFGPITSALKRRMIRVRAPENRKTSIASQFILP